MASDTEDAPLLANENIDESQRNLQVPDPRASDTEHQGSVVVFPPQEVTEIGIRLEIIQMIKNL